MPPLARRAVVVAVATLALLATSAVYAHTAADVEGPVIAKARSVQIKFFDRPQIRISTIAPPPTLDPGIRFFVAVLPCPATPRSFVARNAAGRIVAQLVIAHRLGPKAPC